jgi:hypothetical protein
MRDFDKVNRARRIQVRTTPDSGAAWRTFGPAIEAQASRDTLIGADMRCAMRSVCILVCALFGIALAAHVSTMRAANAEPLGVEIVCSEDGCIIDPPACVEIIDGAERPCPLINR